jgi:hypothetical protein
LIRFRYDSSEDGGLLPFSVNPNPSRPPKLLKLYLKVPPAWKDLGKQTFLVGVAE